MFSPGGFNATFQNLERAVGLGSGNCWSASQVVHAADLLDNARSRYLKHRKLWDENRRRQKSSGRRMATDEELAEFCAPAWFDEISGGPGIERYRWVGLTEFANTQGVHLTSFGPELEPEFRPLLEALPAAPHELSGSVVAHYGPFSAMGEPGTIVEIPYRIYEKPAPDAEYSALSPRQQLLMDCWFTRSNDGYVRQQHLARVVAAEEHWVLPYVLLALGDYVLEVVEEAATALLSLAVAGSWHHAAYRSFIEHNHDLVDLVRQRATSYLRCYHTATYCRSGVRKPRYPAFVVLDSLSKDDGHRRSYRIGPSD